MDLVELLSILPIVRSDPKLCSFRLCEGMCLPRVREFDATEPVHSEGPIIEPFIDLRSTFPCSMFCFCTSGLSINSIGEEILNESKRSKPLEALVGKVMLNGETFVVWSSNDESECLLFSRFRRGSESGGVVSRGE